MAQCGLRGISGYYAAAYDKDNDCSIKYTPLWSFQVAQFQNNAIASSIGALEIQMSVYRSVGDKVEILVITQSIFELGCPYFAW